MRIAFFRRLGRVGTSTFSRVQRQIQGSKPSRKHIKIDDEEQILDEDYLISTPPTPFSRMLRLLLLILLALLLLLLILAYNIYKPPGFLISYLQAKYPSVIFHLPLPASQRIVALTIDDAPSEYTLQILNLLQKHNAKATFFIIGSQGSARPEVVQQIHKQGHEVGNHAWNDEPSRSLPLGELERQVKEVDSWLPPNTATNGAKFFRPGSGFFSGEMVEMLKELGYRTALGSIYPHDAQITNPRRNAKHVLSMVKPGGVIIMHDTRGYSVEEIRLVLEGLEKDGWQVVSLGGLVKVHELSNENKKEG